MNCRITQFACNIHKLTFQDRNSFSICYDDGMEAIDPDGKEGKNFLDFIVN